ncbi:MAG TPA: GNAT family N-acetyltransferase [Thermoanaerobaculia bacterium]
MADLILPYDDAMSTEWNALVEGSRNGTFLHLRSYVEYHRDRFTDFSLVAVDKGRMVGALPANRKGDVVESHGGLTYGGWVVDEIMTLPKMAAIWDSMMQFLSASGVKRLIYKPVPHMHHRVPTEEDLFCLGSFGARPVRRSPMTVVDLQHGPQWQARRLRGIRKARAARVSVGESSDWAGYWQLLEETLRVRYDATPVHTLEEIALLRSLHPDSIRLFTATAGARVIAGVVVFESRRVARAQYIAASVEGKHQAALDLLFHELFTDVFASKHFFDLGTSDGQTGGQLNQSLVDFKEGFGGRTMVQDTYEVLV